MTTDKTQSWKSDAHDVSTYEERYCAFVDILGFREIMGALGTGQLRFERVRELLQEVHSPYDPQIIDFKHCDFRAQSISDAVALSTKPTLAGLEMLLASVRQLTLALLHEGYFARGAVCKGLLYHDASMVFGEALVKAYKLESEVARFPRIMLTKQVVDDMRLSEKKDELEEHIKQAADGPYFLHVLSRLRMLLDLIRSNPLGPEPDLRFFAHIRTQIQLRFSEAADDPRHFEKVQWFARYWNESIIRIRNDVDRIVGAGLDIGPSLIGYR